MSKSLNIRGHLSIHKVDVRGNEELVFDDSNIIVSGMGTGLSYLFAASGSDSILDYQIDRCQIGTDGTSALQVSSTQELGSALSSIDQYGDDSNLFIETATQLLGSTEAADRKFPLIPAHKITRIGESSVRYTIVLDLNTCNDLTLNEIGLFMKNPTGAASNKPILVAYRYFTDIDKTDDFSLIFRWTINF